MYCRTRIGAWTTFVALLASSALLLSCGGGGGANNDPGDAQDAVAGEALVVVQAGAVDDASLETALSAVGTVLSTKDGVYRLELKDGISFEQAQAQLTHPSILLVERNYHVYGYAAPNDADFASQYGTGTGSTKVTTELAAAWGAWTAGAGIDNTHPVVVAVLDTGVLDTHEDLTHKVDTTNARDFVSNPAGAAGAADDNGHGTQVAGIVAAELNNTLGIAGVASWTSGADPQVVKILPVKVLDANNKGNHAAVAAGIAWADTHGANVIVLSLGSVSPSWTLQNAIQAAWGHNRLIVAAAGNNATSLMRYPAAYQGATQGVLSVGSVDATDSLDTTASIGSNYGSWVNLLAPGVGLESTTFGANNAYATSLTGSSFAAAHVAGAAALLWSAYPPNATGIHAANQLTNAELRRALISSIDSYSRPAGKIIQAAGGRLNVQKALANAPNIATAVPASVIFDTAAPKSGSLVNGTLVLTTTAGGATTYDLTASPSSAVTFATPATVTVAAGASSGTFRLTAGAVATSTDVTITATVHGGSAATSAVITIGPPAVSRVAFTPASVVGGSVATGTVTLDTKAPAGGLTITLACVGGSCGSMTIPGTTIVAAGATTGTFAVTTPAVTSNALVRVTAAAPGQSTAVPASGNNLTLTPLLATVSAAPTTVKGGATATGTVKLNGNAPTGGAVVSLLSSAPGVASVPANVTVAAGAKSATFAITTTAIVPPEQIITLTASYTSGGQTTTTTGTIKVQPPAIASLAFSPATVMYGVTSTGTVTLDAVPSGSVTVNLSASDSIVAIPASISISGSKTGTFTVTPAAAVANASVIITATATGYGSKSASVAVQPELAGVTLSPTSVLGGLNATGTVTLNIKAPAGGVDVSVWTNQAAWQINSGAATSGSPATVHVAQATKTATFTVNTAVAQTNTTGVISVLKNGVTKTANLVATEPTLSSLTLASSSVVGGTSVVGTVTLGAAAPAGGIPVNLSTSNTSVATVPTSVTVAAGATTGTFTVTTLPQGAQAQVAITAVGNGVTRTATLTVGATSLAVQSLAFAPTSVVGGTGTSTGTVTLNHTAATPTVVDLSSGNGAVVVPATVTVTANQLTATFTATTTVVSSSTTATVSASYSGGASRTATLTATPATGVSAVAVNPTSITPSPSLTVAGTITLANPAPTGGVDVALTATVGGSPTALVSFVSGTSHVNAGGTSGSFTVNTTTAVANSTVVVITGTYGSSNASANLTLLPPPVLATVIAGPINLPYLDATDTTAFFTLDRAVPAGYAPAYTCTVSGAGVSVPGSPFTVASGASGISNISITGVSAGTKTVTVDCGHGGTPQTFDVVVPAAPTLDHLNQYQLDLATPSTVDNTTIATLSGQASTGYGCTANSADESVVTVTAPSFSAGATTAAVGVQAQGMGWTTFTVTCNGVTSNPVTVLVHDGSNQVSLTAPQGLSLVSGPNVGYLSADATPNPSWDKALIHMVGSGCASLTLTVNSGGGSVAQVGSDWEYTASGSESVATFDIANANAGAVSSCTMSVKVSDSGTALGVDGSLVFTVN